MSSQTSTAPESPQASCDGSRHHPDSVSESVPEDGAMFQDEFGDESGDEEESGGDGKVRSLSKGVPYASFNWTFKRLSLYIKKSKGQASLVVLDFVKKYLGGTKLVFVVGQSGKGKTSLLKELTGLDLHVGNTLKAGTLKYEVCPAIVGNEQYLFVDTPGFGTDIEDADNHREIWSCLASLGPLVTFAGVLFVWGGPETRMTFENKQTIRWVQSFCGPKLFKNITVVTTMWDNLSQDGLEQNWGLVEELMKDNDMAQILNPPAPYHGGQFYHHGFPEGKGGPAAFSNVISMKRQPEQRASEIKGLISRRYSKIIDCKPQIMLEVLSGVDLMATEAAKVLAFKTAKSQVSIREDRVVLELLQEPLRATVPGQLSTKPVPPKKPSSEHKPQPELKQKPESRPEPKSAPEKSWSQSFLEWFQVAKEAAVFFRDMRAAQTENGRKPMWVMWGRFKDWWSGEEPPKA